MLKGAALVFTALALLTACKSPEQKAAEETAKRLEEASKNLEAATKSGEANMGDAMAALGAAMGAATTGGKKVESVDFRALKELLPASVAGMQRTEATGEKNAAMGMQISTARGEYSNNQGSNVTVTLTDIGSMSGLAGMATYAWAMTDIDRETETSYEKTTRFDGHKAIEKYDRSTKHGEISVMVGDRFVAEARGNEVDIDTLKGALKAVNLGKLASLK
jgi:hypothetical protein